jgi:hypothetical protein
MIKFLRLATMIVAANLLPYLAFSQSLSINTDGSTADASSILDVKSTTKGLLIPRMSKTEKNSIASPSTGLIIFQNGPDSIGLYFYDGSAWIRMSANNTAWSLTGNAGTDPATNFLGTTDSISLAFRTKNIEQMRLTPLGVVGLGTSTPNSTYPWAKLEIASDGLGAPTDLLIRNAANNPGYAPGMAFQHSRGTLAAPLAIAANDFIASPFTSASYDGTSYVETAGLYLYNDGGTVSTGKVSAQYLFYARDTNGVYGPRMYFKSNGFLGVGVSAPSAYVDVAGSAGSTTNSLQLRSGNSSGSYTSNQVLFGWNGTATYRHAIKTRHHSGLQNENAIDFYVWNFGVDAAGTVGTKRVMTIDGLHKGMVGIGTSTPRSELHITDGSSSLKAVTDAGGYGASLLITDNIIPRIYLEAAGEAVDKKLMDITLISQSIRFGALNDAGSAFTKSDILVVNRDGNVGINVSTPVVALDVNGSATIGTGNTNTATRTIVSGNGNNLSGDNSVVSGLNNTVSAQRSLVSGWNNTVAGENNLIGGVNNSIVGGYGHSIIVGNANVLTGSASAVFGFLNNANGFTTFAAGDRNTVNAQGGTAFGYQNGITGTVGFVTGSQDTVLGNNAAVFGIGNYGASFSEMALGMYGTSYTAASTSGYNAGDRIFNIGNGASSAARADALTILKSGNVGIGTASPSALLDINSNKIRLRNAKTPTSATDTGNTGDIAWDSNFIYVCVATNTWKRVAIATW